MHLCPLACRTFYFDGTAYLLRSFSHDHHAIVSFYRRKSASTAAVVFDWPEGSGPRIYAYLRPDTVSVDAILSGLATSGASVVCCAPKFSEAQLSQFAHPRIRFSAQLIDLTEIVSTANVCVSNANEGTVARFLLAGVPQLLAPQYVEAQLTARCVETMGAGLTLRGRQTVQSVSMMLDQVVHNAHYKKRAQNFAHTYRDFDANKTLDALVDRKRPADSH